MSAIEKVTSVPGQENLQGNLAFCIMFLSMCLSMFLMRYRGLSGFQYLQMFRSVPKDGIPLVVSENASGLDSGTWLAWTNGHRRRA